MKIVIPSNDDDIWTRLENVLVIKLIVHTDTLAETSNLQDVLHKKSEI